jgi:hypothetical protein
VRSDDSLKRALRNVLWVGGSVCAGKSSAAEVLAARHAWRVYHYDRHEPFHFHRSVPERQPHIIAFMSMTMEQRWVLRPPEEMARQMIAAWAEDRFPMVVDDLLALPGRGPIIAEGAGLFPAQVVPLLSDARAAIWLVASPEFIREVRSVRADAVIRQTSDPQRAFENLVARDIVMAAHIRHEAEQRGFKVLDVNAETIRNVADQVDHHFAPLLRDLRRGRAHVG